MSAWQPVLDRHEELFAEVAPGASIAIVARASRRAGGKESSNLRQVVEPVPMLLWLREPQGMRVRAAEFRGLKSLDSDVLLLADDGALDAALAHQYPLSELKRQLRSGRVLFMVMRMRDALRERGWGDFFEALGLPFQGACR